MSIWDILGCEETKDKMVLKTAYRAKLKLVNPEDDPEGFMRLRQAYEEALNYSDSQNQDVDDSEDSPLLTKIKELYNNYSRRIDVSEWEMLLDRDEFVALDTAEDSFDTLFRFLMEKFFLPKDVWRLFVEHFEIEERVAELAERYPENFIEYVINNSIYDDILDYRLLECKDEYADKFLERYFELDVLIRKHDYKAQGELIDLISEMDVYHPYFEMLKIKSRIQSFESDEEEQIDDEELERRKHVYEELYQDAILLTTDFPEDINFMALCGDLKLLMGDYDEAAQYYENALAISPDNYSIKGKLAEQKMCIGEYAKSRDLFMELLRINHYDNNARGGMIRANTGLIKELEEKRKENPEDKKFPMELGWSYYQIYKFDRSIDILNQFEPDDSQIFEYYNLKGRVYLCLQELHNALNCFHRWKQAIEAIPKDDDSKDALDKKKRYGYVHFLIGDCHLKLKGYNVAREYIEKALSMEHDEIVLSYEAMCELEYETENYEACIKICEELLKREKRSFIAYNYMSKASFKLDFIKETIDASNKAMEIYPYIAEPYETQVDVYLRFDQIDGAKSVVERYKAMELDSQRILYCEARIYATEGKFDRAIELLDSILSEEGKGGSDLEDITRVYNMKANCLELVKKPEEALDMFRKVIQLEPNHKTAYERMGIILKNMGKLSDALDMFGKQIDVAPNVNSYINRGVLNRFFQKYKSAMEDFNEALKFEPNNAFCHSRIGLIYEYHSEFEKALDSFEKALEYTDEGEAKSQIYIYKARVLQCLKRFDDSMAVYTRYIDEFGLNPDVAYDISELAVRMKDISYATRVLQDCINQFEYDENVKNCAIQLISIYGDEGYISRADEALQFVTNRFGSHAEFFAAMGAVLRNKGLYDQAVRHYETAVKLDIDGKQNYYSELVEVLKKKNPFRQDLKKYVQKALINPAEMTNPHAYIKMARLNRTMKKYKEAMSIIDKGLKIKRCNGCFYGKCHDALYEKGLLYEAMKDYDNARLCYKQALAICGHNGLYEEALKRLESKK
ncbi:MAG: tetratricopeptide repeat protein [Lachnospiraceae bacterium]|nr:tetratricopeptide repeat protein [Lachnospiraceae bacterium]